MDLKRNVPLAPLTSLEIGGPANAFVEVRESAELREALAWANRRRDPVAVLGGGTNVLVSDEGWPGLVIRMATRGVRIEGTQVVAAAGESWDSFVERSVRAGFVGLEALSGIPGTVGAAAAQNIGAHGHEIAQSISAVRTIHRKTLETHERTRAECDRSIFPRTREEIVTEVVFDLRPGDGTQLREEVLRLRRAEGMLLDPQDPERRNAGPFFKNPVVADAEADEVEAEARALGFTDMPRLSAHAGHTQLSADWLCEAAGVPKGWRRGDVGTSTRRASVFVNHGGGLARDMVALWGDAQKAVRETFGVSIMPSPTMVFPAGVGQKR